MTSIRHDVVVVGGGAAGLSGALVLGRARRRVAVMSGRTMGFSLHTIARNDNGLL